MKQNNHRQYPHHSIYRISNHPIIFVTVCLHQRRPLLLTPQYHTTLHKLWTASDHWCVGRYILLPDHLHLFVKSRGTSDESISRWISWWKRSFSRIHQSEINLPFWQRDYWDRTLRNSDSYSNKWRYVRDNPVRHQLVNKSEDWPFQGEIVHLTNDKI